MVLTVPTPPPVPTLAHNRSILRPPPLGFVYPFSTAAVHFYPFSPLSGRGCRAETLVRSAELAA